MLTRLRHCSRKPVSCKTSRTCRSTRKPWARKFLFEPLEGRVLLAADFGDAPDTGAGTAAGNYNTLLTDNGPSHTVVVELRMGASVDGDDGTLQNATANADDVNQSLPDDEDGLNNPAADLTLTVGTQPTVNVIVTNTTGSAATLSGWVDYNNDGVFDNATERAQAAVASGTTGGIVLLNFPVVSEGFAGTTYARFRLSTDAAAANSMGAASDGEVEDYMATITIPGVGVASSTTKIASNISGGPILDANDLFGGSVSSLGDLDGDGVSDLAVSAHTDDTGGSDRGAVYVLFMNTDGTVKSTQKIAHQTGGGPTLADGDKFGKSVSSLGDLDGDGVTDLAVGAHQGDTGGSNRGAVYVLFMNTDGTVKSSQKIAHQTGGGPTLADADVFGHSVSSLGDLDGDGVTDLAVGARLDDTGGDRRGSVHVLFMNTDGTVKSTQKIAHQTGGGPTLADADVFGHSVSSLGDLDGDGVTELAVGALRDDTGGSDRGAVYLLFMNTDGTVKSTQKIAHQTGGGPTLADADVFGHSVSSLGDLDGDGVTDLAVGALQDDTGGSNRGAVHVLLMNTDGTVKSWQKIAHQTGGGPTLADADVFGSSVSSLGDLDGDGVSDLAVGAPGDIGGLNHGAVHVLFLTPADAARQITISDAKAIEGDSGTTTAEFTVTLSGADSETVMVDYTTADGTATAGIDYQATAGQLTFLPNKTTHTVTVNVIGDLDVEGNENFFVDLSSATVAIIDDGQGEATIFGDDEPRVVSVEPLANSQNAPTSTDIAATFEQAINNQTVNPQTFVVHSARGMTSAAFSTATSTITADPVTDFFPGEVVRVSATPAIESVLGPVAPHVWQFRAAVPGGTGLFTAAASLGDQDSFDVALGDLDGDGDLDAFVANDGENRVWFNEGGLFSDSGQALGLGISFDVELGDLDGDGDLDAFVVNLYQASRIWLNEGGRFTDSGQRLVDAYSLHASLGDIDGDGDLDVFVSGFWNRLLLNDGGRFIDSGQELGYGFDIAAGDIDGDGDLDAVTTFFDEFFLLKNEHGQFSVIDNSQATGGAELDGPVLGDLDGDGDLDVFATVYGAGNQILLNDGGQFIDSGQRLGDHYSRQVELGDLDGDGDLDAFVANYYGDRVWLNESGQFHATAQQLGSAVGLGIALGDLDGDGDLDAIVANYDAANVVWENVLTEAPPSVTLDVDAPSIAEAGGSTTFTATLSAPALLPVTVQLAISGTATEGEDFTISTTKIFIAAGKTVGATTVTALQDTLNEADESIVVDIVEVTNSTELGQQQQTTTIADDEFLTVTSLTATASGFVAEFSSELDMSVLNLFDTFEGGRGPADVTLEGGAVGPVTGSVVVDPSAQTFTFVKTGGPLLPDLYLVTLRSSDNGLKDIDGDQLDGNGDGIAGDDFVMVFRPELPQNAVTVVIPDFVSGPGQDVNLPADSGAGIPITISDGANVRAIDLRINYDPAMLEITSATVADGAPAGGSVMVNTNTPGLLILVFFTATPLPAGSSTFVNLQASVPATDPNGIYGKQQVVDIHSVTISDGNDNEFPVVADDAVHLVSYLADVSGNGRINASDAAQVARVAALLDDGFAATALTDPRIVGDISGNGRINAADASLVARFAALIDVPQIPPIPSAIAAASGDAPVRFGSLALLDHRHEPVAVMNNDVEAPSGATIGWEKLPDHYVAVDRLMADRSESACGTVDEALEDVMDELFSPLSSVLLPND